MNGVSLPWARPSWAWPTAPFAASPVDDGDGGDGDGDGGDGGDGDGDDNGDGDGDNEAVEPRGRSDHQRSLLRRATNATATAPTTATAVSAAVRRVAMEAGHEMR